MKLDDTFSFGKYKDKTLRSVLNDGNCGLYLMWCLENIRGFHLEPQHFEQSIRERYSKQYLIVQLKKKRQ